MVVNTVCGKEGGERVDDINISRGKLDTDTQISLLKTSKKRPLLTLSAPFVIMVKATLRHNDQSKTTNKTQDSKNAFNSHFVVVHRSWETMKMTNGMQKVFT